MPRQARRDKATVNEKKIAGTTGQMDEDLAYLDRPFREVGLYLYFCRYLGMIYPANLIALDYIVESIVITVGYYYCNTQGGETVQAAFGLAHVFALFFIYSISISITERTSRGCSEVFSSLDYERTKRYFHQGMLTTGLFFVVVVGPAVYYSESLFGMVVHGEGIAPLAADYFKKLYCIYFTFALTTQMKCYTAAQGHENSVVFASTVLTPLVFLCLYFFCSFMKMGVNGWFFANQAYKLIELMVFSVICYTTIDPKTKERIYFSELMNGLHKWLWSTVLYIFSNSAVEISYEVSAFLICLTNSPAQIAALTSFVSIASYIFDIGGGYGLVGRIRIKHLISRNKRDTAKKLFLLSMLGEIVVALILGGILYAVRGYVVEVYASHSPQIREYLLSILPLYSYILTGQFVYNLVMSTAKAIGWGWITALINVFILIVLQSYLGYKIILSNPSSSVSPLLKLLFAMEYICLAVIISGMILTDWNNLDIPKEEYTSIINNNLAYEILQEKISSHNISPGVTPQRSFTSAKPKNETELRLENISKKSENN